MIDNSIASLEQEIQEDANKLNIELIFKLIEKIENITYPSPDKLLSLYIALKIARHHLKKRHYNYYGNNWGDDPYYLKLNDLNYKIKKARRNYYVGIKKSERIAESERRDERNTRY